LREITYALTQPRTAGAALAALAGSGLPPAVEALVELLARPHTAPLAPAALAALDACEHPLVPGALVEALDSPLPSVRLPAVEALARRRAYDARPRLARLLREDDSWPVRRAALRALAEHPAPGRWDVLLGADDPHWRVRHALIGALRTAEGADRKEALARLAALPPNPRVEGVRQYLEACWAGDWTAPPDDWAPPPWPWWDSDPAVLARRLEELGDAGRRAELAAMPALVGHDDERVRRLAVEALRRHAGAPDIVAALGWLEDPRHGAGDSVRALLGALDLDRIEVADRHILHGPAASPARLAWALDQAGTAFPVEEERDRCLGLLDAAAAQPPPVRRALARLAGRWQEAEPRLRAFLDDPDPAVQAEALAALGQKSGGRLDDGTARRLLASPDPLVRAGAVRLAEPALWPAADPDARVRLARAETATALGRASGLEDDPHPLVRAAALTPGRAAELVADPERETSWHVLARAARLCRVPLWRLEPRPAWEPPAAAASPPGPLSLRPGRPPHARALGPRRLPVAPLGVSGHYGLPVEGFARAVEAGVNLLFWEPNYQTLTAFAGRLPGSLRRGLHFLAGTFEATPARVRKDVERALRTLQIEQLPIFLVFWVREWTRITGELRRLLDELRDAGKVGDYGLSSHNRTLAAEALAAGWDPVMVRHSAAHRGAERHVFPQAAARGAGLLAFNSLCYGRLLRPRLGRPAPAAADCYRYTLTQPGVAACMSAPGSLEQLEENLDVLRDLHLPEDRRRALVEVGDDLYREETLFRRVVRSR
jgi:HEAT repeat protein